MSAISHQHQQQYFFILLTQFSPNFKARFLDQQQQNNKSNKKNSNNFKVWFLRPTIIATTATKISKAITITTTTATSAITATVTQLTST